MPPDPIHHLQTAARRAGKHLAPHRPISSVVLKDRHGFDVAALPVPDGDDPAAAEPITASAPLAVAGWDFAGPVPRFDGTLVPVHGRKASVLRVMVESSRPMNVDDLRPAWEGTIVEEGSIRWMVADLRKALKVLFPGLEDPIASSPEGYVLQIRVVRQFES